MKITSSPALPDVSLLLFGAVLLLQLLQPAVMSDCDQHVSPILDDKVAGSEVVVQGRVRVQAKVGPREEDYRAEVSVQCVYKGGPVVSVINVTNVGQPLDKCVTTRLQRGKTYLLYLDRSGATFVHTFGIDPAEGRYLDELRYACGLSVQLPSDSRVGTSAACPVDSFAVYDDDDCNYVTTTTTTSANTNGGSRGRQGAVETVVMSLVTVFSAFTWSTLY